jgi:hypothetical protein
MSLVGHFFPGNTVYFTASVIEASSGQRIAVDSLKFYVYLSTDLVNPVAVVDGVVQPDLSYVGTYTVPEDAVLGNYVVKVQAVKGNFIATDYMRFVVDKAIDV